MSRISRFATAAVVSGGSILAGLGLATGTAKADPFWGPSYNGGNCPAAIGTCWGVCLQLPTSGRQSRQLACVPNLLSDNVAQRWALTTVYQRRGQLVAYWTIGSVIAWPSGGTIVRPSGRI